MSSRPLMRPFQVITNGVMGGTSITSSPTIIDNLSMASYSFSWAGSTPIGVITVQVSNDFKLNAAGGVANAGTWNTLADSAGDPLEGAVSGNTGNGFFNITGLAGYAIRCVYTKTSGTGTLQAYVTSKVM